MMRSDVCTAKTASDHLHRPQAGYCARRCGRDGMV